MASDQRKPERDGTKDGNFIEHDRLVMFAIAIVVSLFVVTVAFLKSQ